MLWGRTVMGLKAGGTTESTMIDNSKSQATILIVLVIIFPQLRTTARRGVLVIVTLIREIALGCKAVVRSGFAWQHRQLSDIARYASSFIKSQPIGNLSIALVGVTVDISEGLPVGIDHLEIRQGFVQRSMGQGS